MHFSFVLVLSAATLGLAQDFNGQPKTGGVPPAQANPSVSAQQPTGSSPQSSGSPSAGQPTQDSRQPSGNSFSLSASGAANGGSQPSTGIQQTPQFGSSPTGGAPLKEKASFVSPQSPQSDPSEKIVPSQVTLSNLPKTQEQGPIQTGPTGIGGQGSPLLASFGQQAKPPVASFSQPLNTQSKQSSDLTSSEQGKVVSGSQFFGSQPPLQPANSQPRVSSRQNEIIGGGVPSQFNPAPVDPASSASPKTVKANENTPSRAPDSIVSLEPCDGGRCWTECSKDPMADPLNGCVNITTCTPGSIGKNATCNCWFAKKESSICFIPKTTPTPLTFGSPAVFGGAPAGAEATIGSPKAPSNVFDVPLLNNGNNPSSKPSDAAIGGIASSSAKPSDSGSPATSVSASAAASPKTAEVSGNASGPASPPTPAPSTQTLAALLQQSSGGTSKQVPQNSAGPVFVSGQPSNIQPSFVSGLSGPTGTGGAPTTKAPLATTSTADDD